MDAEGLSVEVSVLSEDVSTFLMFAPEEEYLGAKVKHVLLCSLTQDGIIPLWSIHATYTNFLNERLALC